MFFVLILFFLSLRPVSASNPKITLDSLYYPAVVSVGDTFIINFSLTNLDIITAYHYKIAEVQNLQNVPSCDNNYHYCFTVDIGVSETQNLFLVSRANNVGTGTFKIRFLTPTPILIPLPPKMLIV